MPPIHPAQGFLGPQKSDHGADNFLKPNPVAPPIVNDEAIREGTQSIETDPDVGFGADAGVDANDALSRLAATSLGDAPAPRSVDEARRVLESRGNTTLPVAEDIDSEIEGLSGAYALNFLRAKKVPTSVVSAEDFDQLRGAFRYTLTHLYSPIADEERREYLGEGMKRLMGRIEQGAITRLNQIQSTREFGSGAIKSGPGGTSVIIDNDATAKEVQDLQNMAAIARSFGSRSNEVKIQRLFADAVDWAITREQTDIPPTDIQARELGLLDKASSLAKARTNKDFPTFGTKIGSFAFEGWDVPLRDRFRSLLKKSLEDPGSFQGIQQAVRASFQGVLFANRLQKLGIPKEAAEQVSVEGTVALTHPTLLHRFADKRLIAEVEEATREIEEPVAKASVQMEEAQNRQPLILEDFAQLISGPLRQLDLTPIAPGIAEGGMSGVGSGTLSALDWVESFMVNATRKADPVLRQTLDNLAQKNDALVATYSMGAMKRSIDLTDSAWGKSEEAYRIALGSGKPEDVQALIAQKPVGEALTWAEKKALFQPKDGIKHAIGLWAFPWIAQDVFERLQPFGIDRKAFQAEFDTTLRKELDDILVLSRKGTFDPEKGVMESNERTAKLMQGWLAGEVRATKLLGAIGANAMFNAGGITQSLIKGIFTNPTRGGVEISLGLATGAVGTQVRVLTLGKINRAIANTVAVRRWTRSLSRALATEPKAVDTLRRFFLKKMGDNPNAANMRAMGTALDTIALRQTAIEEAADAGAMSTFKASRRELRGDVADARRLMRQLEPETLDEISDALQMDGVTKALLSTPNSGAAMIDAAAEIGEVLQLGDLKAPGWLARHSEEIGTKVARAINAGEKPEIRIPFSEDLLRKGRSDFRNRVRDWAENYLDHLQQSRIGNGMAKARQLSFLDYFLARKAGEVQEASMTVELAAQPELRRLLGQQMRQSFETSRRVRADKRIIEGRDWDRGVKLSNADYMRQATLEDLVYWGLMHKEVGELGLWRAGRFLGETAKKFDGRLQRLLNRVDEDTLAGMKRSRAEGFADQVALHKEAETLKSKLTRELLNSDGIVDTVTLDETGTYLTSSKVKRLTRERAAAVEGVEVLPKLEEALDELKTLRKEAKFALREARKRARRGAVVPPDHTKALELQIAEFQKEIGRTMGRIRRTRNIIDNANEELVNLTAESLDPETFGLVQREGVSSVWSEVLSQKGREAVRRGGSRSDMSQFAELLVRAGDLNDGTVRSQLKRIEEAGFDMKLMGAARSHQVKELFDEFQRMTPDQQELFQAAMAAADDTGQLSPLAALREQAPVRFAGLAPASQDAGVERLLVESEAFRSGLLRDMLDADLINQAQFNDLAGPYVPQLYEAHEYQTILGKHAQTLLGKRGDFAALLKTGDFSEFELQRDPQLFRALVQIRGKAAIKQGFATREEALQWVKAKYGTRGKVSKIEGTEGVEGRTNLDEAFKILDPLGKELREALVPIPSGPALFQRLETLVNDIASARFAKTMDRTGWAFTKDEFLALENSSPLSTRQALAKNFVELGEAKMFGALRGKVVHKKVARALQRFQDGSKLVKTLQREMRDIDSNFTLLSTAITGIKDVFLGGARLAKQYIVTNRIARNARVVAGNFISDAAIFARMAAGDGYLTTPGGWRSMKKAVDLIFERGVRFRDSDIAQQLLERGILDETLAEAKVSSQLNKPLSDFLLGKSPKDAKVWGPFTKGDPKQTFKFFMDSLKKWKAPEGIGDLHAAVGALADADPQIGALSKRWETVDKFIKSTQFDKLAPATKGQIQSYRLSLESALNAETPNMINLMSRGWQRLIGLTLGRATDRFGLGGVFSRELYGRINNVNRLGAALYMVEEKGLSMDEAMKRVSLFMQTYSKVPDSVRTISTSPVGTPILSFGYEAIRIMKNAATHDFGRFAGIVSGLAAANFTTLAGTGTDPYYAAQVMKADHPGAPGAMAFATSMMIPSVSGNGFSSFTIPAMNLFNLFRRPMGLYGQLTAANDEEMAAGSPVDRTLGLARNFAVKQMLMNPIANTFMSLMLGRDPETGNKVRVNSLLGANVQQWSEIMLPPVFPLAGSLSGDLVDAVDKPPRMRTGRKVSLALANLDSLTGLRFRGPILEELGAKPALDALAKTMFLATGSALRRPLPQKIALDKPFNEVDILGNIFNASAVFAPESEKMIEMVRSDVYPELREAYTHLQSDDPALREFGKKRLKEVLAEDSKRRRVEAQLELGDKSFEDQRKLLERVMRAQSFEDFYANYPILRQTAIIRKTHEILGSRDPALVRKLVISALFTDQGKPRNFQSPERLKEAVTLLDNYLQAPATNLEADTLTRMRNYLRVLSQEVDLNMRAKRLTDEEARESEKLLRELRGE
jgi:hypothetical protein